MKVRKKPGKAGRRAGKGTIRSNPKEMQIPLGRRAVRAGTERWLPEQLSEVPGKAE
jgi:hypothetical protein